MTGVADRPSVIDPATLAAVVLAGGQSRRMGEDKARIRLAGRPLIAHVVARLRPQVWHLAINRAANLPPIPAAELDPPHDPLPQWSDPVDHQPGPLAGIAAALGFGCERAASHVLTVPVDCPFLPHDLLTRLAGSLEGIPAGAIAVARSRGALHPVVALWPTRLLPALMARLEAASGQPDLRRVTGFIAEHSSVAVDFPDQATQRGPLDPFFNLNHPQDLAEAERFCEVLTP